MSLQERERQGKFFYHYFPLAADLSDKIRCDTYAIYFLFLHENGYDIFIYGVDIFAYFL